jgi:uncharacterized protein YoxC
VVASVSAGGWAAIIAAIAWAVIALVLVLVMTGMFRVLESTKMLIDGIRQETVPLLSEVTVTVTSVNKELERVDVVLESTGSIVRAAERFTALMEQIVTNPLLRLATVGAGAARALRRFRRSRMGR